MRAQVGWGVSVVLAAIGGFILGGFLASRVVPRGLVVRDGKIKVTTAGKYTLQIKFHGIPGDDIGTAEIICAEKVREPMHVPVPKGERRGGA